MDTRKLLLTAQDIEEMQGETKTHFLNPNAVRINKSLGDAVGLKNMGIHIIYVEPGKDTTEYHKHFYEEECIYVMSGRGELIIEDDRYAFEAGDFVGFPADTAAHSLANAGEETLVCLVVGQRLAQDVGVYPHKGKKIYRNNGVWDVVDCEHVYDPRLESKK
jgi:uncharacterized cupin superfamily protein